MKTERSQNEEQARNLAAGEIKSLSNLSPSAEEARNISNNASSVAQRFISYFREAGSPSEAANIQWLFPSVTNPEQQKTLGIMYKASLSKWKDWMIGKESVQHSTREKIDWALNELSNSGLTRDFVPHTEDLHTSKKAKLIPGSKIAFNTADPIEWIWTRWSLPYQAGTEYTVSEKTSYGVRLSDSNGKSLWVSPSILAKNDFETTNITPEAPFVADNKGRSEESTTMPEDNSSEYSSEYNSDYSWTSS